MKEHLLEKLEKYLEQNQDAKKLSPNYNSIREHIGDEGVQFIMYKLPSSCTELDLSDNGIGVEGAKYIANELKRLNVTKLNLSRNSIGDQGVKYIMEGIAQ